MMKFVVFALLVAGGKNHFAVKEKKSHKTPFCCNLSVHWCFVLISLFTAC